MVPRIDSVIGPFTEVITMDGLPEKGHIDDSSLNILKNVGIAIHAGHIVDIASFDELRKHAKEVIHIRYPAVVLPGFVDAHTHLCFAGSRADEYALRLNGTTYKEILARGGGILNTVRKTRAASHEELLASMKQRCQELLSWGVTTCEVKSGYGLTVEDECKMLTCIRACNEIDLIPTCLAAHVLPPEYKDASAYLNMLTQTLFPLLKQNKLTRRIDIFVEKEAFSCEIARPYLKAAQTMGFQICLHADQFSRGGALLAAELGASSADHLENSIGEDFKALKHANVTPVVLPGASLGLGMPFAKAKEMLNHNLPVVIASDWNPGSAPMGNLLIQAALIGAAEKLSTAEIFAGITCRPAALLGLNDRGSLRKGKCADFIIFPCGDYREILYSQGRIKPIEKNVRGIFRK